MVFMVESVFLGPFLKFQIGDADDVCKDPIFKMQSCFETLRPGRRLGQKQAGSFSKFKVGFAQKTRSKKKMKHVLRCFSTHGLHSIRMMMLLMMPTTTRGSEERPSKNNAGQMDMMMIMIVSLITTMCSDATR
jgi:hypothetical protein